MPDFGNGGSIFLFLKFATHVQFCVFSISDSGIGFFGFCKDFQFGLRKDRLLGGVVESSSTIFIRKVLKQQLQDGRKSDTEAIADAETVYFTISAIFPSAQSRQVYSRELLGLCSGHRPGDRRGYSGRHMSPNGP